MFYITKHLPTGRKNHFRQAFPPSSFPRKNSTLPRHKKSRSPSTYQRHYLPQSWPFFLTWRAKRRLTHPPTSHLALCVCLCASRTTVRKNRTGNCPEKFSRPTASVAARPTMAFCDESESENNLWVLSLCVCQSGWDVKLMFGWQHTCRRFEGQVGWLVLVGGWGKLIFPASVKGSFGLEGRPLWVENDQANHKLFVESQWGVLLSAGIRGCCWLKVTFGQKPFQNSCLNCC